MNLDDILVWPGGAWCFGNELEEMTGWLTPHDDFKILVRKSPEWETFLAENEYQIAAMDWLSFPVVPFNAQPMEIPMSENETQVEAAVEAEVQVEDMTLLDGDNVDDLSVDNIGDLAGYIDPPDGLYILKVNKAHIHNYEVKGSARKKIQHQYAIVETVELSDEAEPIPEDGAIFSEGFMIPDGLEFWKAQAKRLLGTERVTGRTVGQVLLDLTESGPIFKARVTTKSSKGKGENKDKTYRNIQVRVQEILTSEGEVAA